MPASQKNRPCQLTTDSDHSTGSVAAIEPSPPAIMWKPVIRPHARRIPQRDRLDGGHQSAGEAQPDQHARHDQLAEREAQSEQGGACGGHGQQHDLHAARPVAVDMTPSTGWQPAKNRKKADVSSRGRPR